MNEHSIRLFGTSKLTDNLPVNYIVTGYGLDGPGTNPGGGG